MLALGFSARQLTDRFRQLRTRHRQIIQTVFRRTDDVVQTLAQLGEHPAQQRLIWPSGADDILHKFPYLHSHSTFPPRFHGLAVIRRGIRGIVEKGGHRDIKVGGQSPQILRSGHDFAHFPATHKASGYAHSRSDFTLRDALLSTEAPQLFRKKAGVYTFFPLDLCNCCGNTVAVARE